MITNWLIVTVQFIKCLNKNWTVSNQFKKKKTIAFLIEEATGKSLQKDWNPN